MPNGFWLAKLNWKMTISRKTGSIGVVIETLKNRRDFLAVRKGARFTGRFFVLQCLHASHVSKLNQQVKQAPQGMPAKFTPSFDRFGFTVTKKIGNAVERNRIRRRLKAAVQCAVSNNTAAAKINPGGDYVLIARREALNGEFSSIVEELVKFFDQAQVKLKKGKTHGRQ